MLIEKFGVDHHSKTINHKKITSLANKGIDLTKYEDRVCNICGDKFRVRKLHKKITCSKSCFKKFNKTKTIKIWYWKIHKNHYWKNMEF
jgi:PHP family Zn ribbon phosphoesterase